MSDIAERANIGERIGDTWGDDMVRMQIQLSEEEAAAVRRLARERSMSTAAIIRAAVDEYVERESCPSLDERWQRSLASLGGFHSGRADLSENHDDEFAAAEGK